MMPDTSNFGISNDAKQVDQSNKELNNRRKREIIGVDKQALIDDVLELERQEEIQAFLMLGYLQQLKALVQHLEILVKAEKTSHARTLLYRHFLPDEDWMRILTDERIQAWQDEANSLSIIPQRDFLRR